MEALLPIYSGEEGKSKKIMQAKYIVIKLEGRPASKKNSKTIIPRYTKTGKLIHIPVSSKAHNKFEKSALEQLQGYHLIKDFPLQKMATIHYKFFQKGKYEQDNDNAEGTINDILQEAGIIVNDKIIKKWSGEIIPNSPDWLTEITIFY